MLHNRLQYSLLLQLYRSLLTELLNSINAFIQFNKCIPFFVTCVNMASNGKMITVLLKTMNSIIQVNVPLPLRWAMCMQKLSLHKFIWPSEMQNKDNENAKNSFNIPQFSLLQMCSTTAPRIPNHMAVHHIGWGL